MNILLLDDDEAFRTRLGAALTRRGHAVTLADSPACACACVEHAPLNFDACVVDLRLPEGNGLDFVHWMRARQPECRILVLTGFGSIASAVEAMRLGATDYLTKPADADQILAALQRESVQGLPRREPPVSFPSLDRVEWEHIQRVLGECGGNISLAARTLGIERRTLQRKLQKLPPAN